MTAIPPRLAYNPMHKIAQNFSPAESPWPPPPGLPGLQVYYEAIPWETLETRDEESIEVLRECGIGEGEEGSSFLLSWWAVDAGRKGQPVIASGRTHVIASVVGDEEAFRDVAVFASWRLAVRELLSRAGARRGARAVPAGGLN